MIIDADVHHYVNSIRTLLPYLPLRWQRYVEESGFQGPAASPYPKGSPYAARTDAAPRMAAFPAPTSRSSASSFWTVGRSSTRSSTASTISGACRTRIRPRPRPGRQRLDAGRVAGEGAPAARGDRRPDQQPGARGDGDRPARRSARLRRGAAPRPLRRAVRPAPLPPDLRRRGAPWPARRHPLRRPPRQPDHRLRLAFLLHRGPHRR